MILARNGPGRLKRGVTSELSEKANIPGRVLRRIWKNGRHGGVNVVINKRRGRCGRKQIMVDPVALAAIPLKDRKTIHGVSAALGMKKTTVYKLLKEHEFRKQQKTWSRH